MRQRQELNLKSNVLSVETDRAHISTKSYRLLAGGNRELLQDIGGPTPATSSLFSLVRFDEQGRVIEDVDVDRRPACAQAYRHR